MTDLKTQPTAAPTRKMTFMIVATFIVYGGLAVAEIFVPGLRDAVPADDLIAGIVVLATGYMTKDRA